MRFFFTYLSKIHFFMDGGIILNLMESSARGCNGKQNLKDLFCVQKKPLYCQISNLYLSQCRLLFPWDCACQILYKTLNVIQMLCDSTSHNQPHYKYNVEIKQGNQTSWCALVMKCFTHMLFLIHLQTANLHPWAFPSCAPLQMCTFQCGYI